MSTVFNNLVKSLRGERVVVADSDKEAWVTAFTDAWIKGYDEARQYEREDRDCASDTIITLVDTQTNAGKALSVTLERVSIVSTKEGVSIMVITPCKEYSIMIDTARTEVYSVRKYYYND